MCPIPSHEGARPALYDYPSWCLPHDRSGKTGVRREPSRSRFPVHEGAATSATSATAGAGVGLCSGASEGLPPPHGVAGPPGHYLRLDYDDAVERSEVATRLYGMLTTPGDGKKAFAQLRPSITGEYMFVCCLPTDNLGWLTEQLYEHRDMLVVSAAVADRMIFTTQLARSGEADWPSLTDLGLSFDTTVGDLMLGRSVQDDETPVALVV